MEFGDFQESPGRCWLVLKRDQEVHGTWNRLQLRAWGVSFFRSGVDYGIA